MRPRSDDHLLEFLASRIRGARNTRRARRGWSSRAAMSRRRQKSSMNVSRCASVSRRRNVSRSASRDDRLDVGRNCRCRSESFAVRSLRSERDRGFDLRPRQRDGREERERRMRTVLTGNIP